MLVVTDEEYGVDRVSGRGGTDGCDGCAVELMVAGWVVGVERRADFAGLAVPSMESKLPWRSRFLEPVGALRPGALSSVISAFTIALERLIWLPLKPWYICLMSSLIFHVPPSQRSKNGKRHESTPWMYTRASCVSASWRAAACPDQASEWRTERRISRISLATVPDTTFPSSSSINLWPTLMRSSCGPGFPPVFALSL